MELIGRGLDAYFGRIVSAIPKFMQKMDEDEWQRFLEILGEKHYLASVEKRVTQTDKFIEGVVNSLDELDADEVKFCIDEVKRVQDLDPRARRGAVDLESVLWDSSKNGVKDFERDDARKLNGVFFTMYYFLDHGFPGSVDSFVRLRKAVARVPKKLRGIAIEYAKRISAIKLGKEEEARMLGFIRLQDGILQEKCMTLDSYALVLEDRTRMLGNRFAEWVERGIETQKDLKGLREYFEDKVKYFDRELDDLGGGLALSDIHERLVAYTRALTGRDVKIEKVDSLEITCGFDGTRFLLPRTVLTGREFDENFGIYKALVSFQAGALMFGTYDVSADSLYPEICKRIEGDVNLKKVIESFEHPKLAKGVFEILEIARIRGRLERKYPGLRKDLESLMTHVAEGCDSGEITDCESALRELRGEVYGRKDGIAKDEIESLRKDVGVAETLNAVYSIFQKLKKRIDISQALKEEEEEMLNLDLENVVQTAGYLIAAPGKEDAFGRVFRYDEWDCIKKAYREGFVQLIETELPLNDDGSARGIIDKNQKTIIRLRNIFESLRPEERETVRNQLSGDVNYDALVQAQAELAAGITPSEKLFTRDYKNTRSVAALVVSDLSGSLKRFPDLKKPTKRVIDIIKQAQVYFCEALDAVGDSYALAGFSGETEKSTRFFWIKDFHQQYGDAVKARISSLAPMQQNRDGAGIRHAANILSQQDEKTKLMICLMEGVPHDFGYEGKYALEDTVRAIIEAKNKGCVPVVLAFGSNLGSIRDLENHCVYREVEDADEVPEKLPEIYRMLTL